MASLSSPGIGSGLDINGIIGKLMQAEARPLTLLQKKEASYQAKLSAFGTLKSALSSLQNAALALKKTSLFEAKSVTLSEPALLSASATSAATSGAYEIEVIELAQAERRLTNVDFGGDTFQGGTLSLQIGTTLHNVTIADGSRLEDIRAAINNARIGVTATLVRADDFDRLVLTSNTTGAANALTITQTPDGSSGGTRPLADLVNALEIDRPARDANIKIDGLTVTRPSNAINDAIEGLTLQLKQTGTTRLTVAPDNSPASNAIQAFVKAYNDVVGQLKQLTAYDAANRKAATLTGDGVVRAIQTQLSNLVASEVTGVAGNIARLSDIGIAIQKDGTLAVDTTKLSAALNDPNKDVAALFTQNDPSNPGIAQRWSERLGDLLSRDGPIAQRSEGLNASIRDVQRRSEAFQQRLSQIEARYRAQFSALDKMIASMNQTSTFLTQQLANLPSLTSNTR